MARRDEDSLLIQSAEALGRVIDSLRRQLRSAGFAPRTDKPSRKAKASARKKTPARKAAPKAKKK